MKKNYLFLLVVFTSCKTTNTKTENWQPLFNGKDLSGWDIKIKDQPIGDNYKNTFRIEDSMIRVDYSSYDSFNLKFGHLYTQPSFAFYKLKMQYRFTGTQIAGAPSWGNRNSGVMIHAQSAKSMELHQNFPVSLEVQFLCGNGNDTVPTGNVCTPGTWLTFNGKPFYNHIQNSSSKTYFKNEWVTSITEVYGDSLVRQIINNDTVLIYTKPMIGEGFVGGNNNWHWAGIMDSMVWINKANTPLGNGHIALQAESQPVDFKNIMLLNLKGCMDKKAKNYKDYFVKADNNSCVY